jgi:hypothetical protein
MVGGTSAGPADGRLILMLYNERARFRACPFTMPFVSNITSLWLPRIAELPRMNIRLQRVLGLLLVLSVSAWGQAFCPMMLFPQMATSCGQTSAHSAATSGENRGHQCCHGRNTRMQNQHCGRSSIRHCASLMSCCSVQPSPASTQKVMSPAMGLAILGRVLPSNMQLRTRFSLLEESEPGAPIRGVLDQKEDLRI